MQKKNVLITGASGMLGATLANELKDLFNVFATSSLNFKESNFRNFYQFDLRNENYKSLIEWSSPDVIIHCAALTNGNYCQNNPQEAFVVNGLACSKLLQATDEKVKIIYISTDAVFPSSLHLAKEDDLPHPESVYGKSKELGEFFLLSSRRDFHIIRTTIVGLNINPIKTGFVEWILGSVKDGVNVTLFEDVVFTPISIWRLSKELIKIIEHDYPDRILHLAGSEVVTKYQFGKLLVDRLAAENAKLIPTRISEFKGRAKRSTDQTLSVKRTEEILSIHLPKLSETVDDIVKKYRDE